MAEQEDRKSHFLLQGAGTTSRYRSPQQARGQVRRAPDRDRNTHGRGLIAQVERLKEYEREVVHAQTEAGIDQFGLQIEIESFPDIELAFESLARDRSGIELLNVRLDEDKTSATVFVPDGKLDHFERLIGDYLEEKKDKSGRPRDNKHLVNSIQQIRQASLRALWTDDPDLFPSSPKESICWEVWLPVRKNRTKTTENFRKFGASQGLDISHGMIEFPERSVLLAFGTVEQMTQSVLTLNSIAELRLGKETAEFFDELPPAEQPEWVDDLAGRTQTPPENADVPYIAILDTGTNNAHPLLAQSLAADDLHTVEPGWGSNDEHGHGTAMAGLANLGDLTSLLDSDDPIYLEHRLESVKLIRQEGANGNESEHHGYLTGEAISRPEANAPNRRRVFSMAVTARDNRDRGRPSAWSSAIDGLASDVLGFGENPRLIVISAGNIDDPNAWQEYPASNATDGIHDPGQAWNALTVGAYTELVHITEDDADDYEPIAPYGGLSPFSTSSLTWQPMWPVKPDVVFEGGNVAKNGTGAAWMRSLSLLTTHFNPSERLLTTANATSAASALASRLAAQLMAQYTNLWPESVRALIVHSAEWTEAMQEMFLPNSKPPTKRDWLSLIRHCGYGVPSLERAMWSYENSLTLVCQDELHPFQKESGKQPKLRDMNLHRLPWPLAELEALGEIEVEMRVTLSYFIEPNPSDRGFSSRYRYESHGLRFDVKRPSESDADFQARINAEATDEEENTTTSTSDPDWIIGKQNRHRGSLHTDIWRGSAADLASRGVIAVYPALGWWKTRTALERYNRSSRYSLIVSITTQESDVMLYTAVENQIEIAIGV